MKVLSKEEIKVLAEQNGWPLARAEGYVAGEVFRRRGTAPSKYVQIGIDDYSLGFRAGYYERRNIERQSISSMTTFSGPPIAQIKSQAAEDSVKALDVAMGQVLSTAG